MDDPTGMVTMSALTEFLYPAPAKRKATAILGWWERRRLAYNIAVGGAGLVSVATGYLLHLLPAGGPFFPAPLAPMVVFGVMANLCYLLGPAAEILVEKLFRGQVLPTGPALYRIGLTFSIGLALFPTLLMLIAWVARIVLRIF